MRSPLVFVLACTLAPPFFAAGTPARAISPAPGVRIVGPRGESTPVVNTGLELQLRLVNAAGETIQASRWESDNTSVAEVTNSGVVRGRRLGFAAVRAESSGGLSAQVYVPVVNVRNRTGAQANGDTRTDRSGNVFLSSPRDHVIYKVSAQSSVQTVAGKRGKAAFRDGSGKKARFNTPTALGIDNRANGGLYVADAENDCIRKMAFRGTVSVVLGAPGRTQPMTLDVTPAADASMSGVRGIASVGSDFYFADTDHHAIYYFDASRGVVRLVAGSPDQGGYADGTGRGARFQSPTGIAVNARGTLLAVADTGNNVVRLVSLEHREDGNIAATVTTLGTSASARGNGTKALGIAGPPGSAIAFRSPDAVTFDGTDNVYVVDDDGAVVVVRRASVLPERVDLAQFGTLGIPTSIAISGFEAVLLDEAATTAATAVRSAAVGAPVIDAVLPRVSPLEGGVEVTVDGENFAPEARVTLGDVEVSSFTLEGTRRLRFVVPSQRAPGLRTLTVRTRGGVAQSEFAIESPSLGTATAGDITTIAGGIPFLGDGGNARKDVVRMRPFDIAVDGQGNVIVADRDNHRIRRIDAESGLITTLAGTGEFGFGGDGGPATGARLSFPRGVAVDGAGNVLIADTGNARIRRVDAQTGTITTIAGTGEVGFGGDGGPALDAMLADPEGVDVDAAGNVFVSDTQNHRVRRVAAATGRISTIAGSGGEDSDLAFPGSLAIDAAGNVFVALPQGAAVRRIDGSSGVVTTVAGTGVAGYGGDGGRATRARLHEPAGVDVDAAGNLYIGDAFNDRVRRVDTRGRIRTVAGTGEAGSDGDGGPALAARLMYPSGIAVSGTDDLIVADTENHRLRLVDGLTLVIGTIGGSSETGGVGDGGPAAQGQLANPTSLSLDQQGNVYVADFDNNRIRRIDAVTGTISTFAGSGAYGFGGDEGPATSALLARPTGVTVDVAGNVFVADTDNNRIRRIDGVTGTISTVAGTGEIGFEGDGGLAMAALLHRPGAVVTDASGNVFVSDTMNHRIRRIDSDTQTIATVAGTGIAGMSGDGGPATAAKLSSPIGLALDEQENLFIADFGNHRIRRVSAGTGVMATVVGSDEGFSGDGGPASNAQLTRPIGITVDGAGNLFVADTDNNRIRRVDGQTGIIATVAGNGMFAYSGDGASALAAEIATPYALEIDGDGNLLIAASGNQSLRAIKGIGVPR